MRPEDVELGPEVQRFAHNNSIDLDEVRHARAATGQPIWTDDQPDAGNWQVFIGQTSDGRKLRMTCGPELHIVATCRPVE